MIANVRQEQLMRRCFALAEKGKGFVSPNPLVGSLLVVHGKVVASGYHQYFGGPHAEVECLRRFKGDLRNATLFVNLEPCSYFGKTPPCTDLILQRGIRKVVVAMKDPNPRVAGKGIAKLRRAGVFVTSGVLEREAHFQNRFFMKHIRTQLPYVHLKIAQTLDGFIAENRKGMQYITCAASRRRVHEWRTEYDAILVGAGTIKIDNPQLNVRLATGRDPAVIILDGNLRVTGKEAVFSSADRRTILVCVSNQAWVKAQKSVSFLQAKGVHVLPFPSRKGVIPLTMILRELYKRNFGSLLVEGGATVANEFVKSDLVDEFSLFISPTKFGKGVRGITDSNAERIAQWFVKNEFDVCSSGADSLTTGLVINK